MKLYIYIALTLSLLISNAQAQNYSQYKLIAETNKLTSLRPQSPKKDKVTNESEVTTLTKPEAAELDFTTSRKIDSHYFEEENVLFDKFRIRSIKGDTEEIYMQCLVAGKAGLYLKRSENEKHYFLHYGGELIPLSEQEDYKQVLYDYLGELEESAYQISYSRFNETDLVNIIRDYNYFMNGEDSYKEYKRLKNIRKKLWVSAGAGREDSPLVQQSNFSSMHLGMAYNMTFRDVSENLRWHGAVNYHYLTKGSLGFNAPAAVHVLKAELGANYTFTQSKLQPFIFAGVNPSLHLNGSPNSDNQQETFEQTAPKAHLYKNLLAVGFGLNLQNSKGAAYRLRTLIDAQSVNFSVGVNIFTQKQQSFFPR